MARVGYVRATMSAVCVALVSGCGGVGSVSGTLSVGGKPVTTGALITFHGSDGRTAQAMVEPDGTYSVEQVPAGEVEVTVQNTFLPGSAPRRPHFLTEIRKPGDPAPPKMPDYPKADLPKMGNQVPPRYAESGAGLARTVRRGENTIDLNLDP
jgi:hypothetical protein